MEIPFENMKSKSQHVLLNTAGMLNARFCLDRAITLAKTIESDVQPYESHYGESGKVRCIPDIYQHSETTSQLIEQILAYTKSSRPENAEKPIPYPGENTLKTRIRNLEDGIPVDVNIWNQVLSMG